MSEVARYLVLDNREIRIHPLPGTRDVDVRTFLFGSVLGALLHARQMLVLHASAVETERGAVVFMGRSGAGKSMLLGAFLQRGYPMLSDDKAVVVLDGHGAPKIVPGLPQIRLARDAVNRLRYPVNGYQLLHSLDKYVLPVAAFSPAPIGLYAAYSLGPHNRTDIRLERVAPLDRFQLLNRYTYRRRFMRQASQRQAHFRLLGAVAGQTRVARVVRPDHPCLIDELRARIEEDLAQ